MKKGIIFTILFTLFAFTSFANSNKNEGEVASISKSGEMVSASVSTTYGISGTILDITNNETLAGATIVVNGKKYYSNLDGQFNVPALKEGKYRLSVEFISYNSSDIEVDVHGNSNITVRLDQK